ncbi:carotenoid biosynthesis protein [Guptibacillus algicola]|uniref:carotenoid biosynthesis protein n=1 Tax=Guptibacillus algicola TaxID=225844 RepID=UPI001CD7B0B9|nr:carotenoid biosynthesis protein [Alkalihalobacillus algicola]MCA0988253.1 carotenoid biosynthesis protein [Alkalihalobacillus algicola]
MYELDKLVFKLFIFWYGCGVVLVGFDLLPPFLEWANAFFLILCGVLAGFYFIRTFGKPIGYSISILIFTLSMAAESLGVHYGWIFGQYNYSGDFGFKVVDVPIGIGFAWVMVVAVTHVLSIELLKKMNHSLLKWMTYSIVGALIAVLIDLIIDPVAYLVKGYWGWEGTSFYYEVPMQNFTGWFFVSLLFHLLLYPVFVRNKIASREAFIFWKHRMAALFGMVMGMFIFLGLLDQLWLAVTITGLPTYLLLYAYRKSVKTFELSSEEKVIV